MENSVKTREKQIIKFINQYLRDLIIKMYNNY